MIVFRFYFAFLLARSCRLWFEKTRAGDPTKVEERSCVGNGNGDDDGGGDDNICRAIEKVEKVEDCR